MPVAGAEEEARRALPSPSETPEPRARLVVVDDEPVILEILHRRLTRDGYEVATGSTECGAGAEDADEVLDGLAATGLGPLPPAARDVVRREVTGLLRRLDGR